MPESTGELQRAGTGVKPPLSYILDFGPALDRIVEVMERGAKKYSRNNWKGTGKNADLAVQLDSVMRHLAARQCGEVYDAEMGTDHLANAVCGLLFALYHHGQKPGLSMDEKAKQEELVTTFCPLAELEESLITVVNNGPAIPEGVGTCSTCLHEQTPTAVFPCNRCDIHKTPWSNWQPKDPNACQCVGSDGKPLNQCNECPR